jgi:hypothetical protein
MLTHVARQVTFLVTDKYIERSVDVEIRARRYVAPIAVALALLFVVAAPSASRDSRPGEITSEGLEKVGLELAASLTEVDHDALVRSTPRGRVAPDRIGDFTLDSWASSSLGEYARNTTRMRADMDRGGATNVTSTHVSHGPWVILSQENGVTVVEYEMTFVRHVRQLRGDTWEEVIPVEVVFDGEEGSIRDVTVKDLNYLVESASMVGSNEGASASGGAGPRLLLSAAMTQDSISSTGVFFGPAYLTDRLEGSGYIRLGLTSTQKKAAAEYALKWWNSKNPDFPTNYSNDCTNFVSQAMYAGGWTQVSGLWNSNSAWWGRSWGPPYASYPWGGAENFYKFARNESARTTSVPLKDLRVGDVLQYKLPGSSVMNHTMIVTQYLSSTAYYPSEFYLTYHTSNTKNKPFSSLSSLNVLWFTHKT